MAYIYFFLQGGNAHIDSSGSLFQEEKDGEFITLIDIKTGKALDVRDASTAPDTPILALHKTGEDSQLWKYSIPTLVVTMCCIHVLKV